MPRLKRRRLRGSVTQNSFTRSSNGMPRRWPEWLTPTLRISGALLALSLLTAGLAWLWHSGWPARQANNAVTFGMEITKASGFAVRDVLAEGRNKTSNAELLAALQVKSGQPIFAFNPETAHDRILQLPWVETALIERRLPDTIYVKLGERQPLARWQRDGKVVLIDSAGQELPSVALADYEKLPLLVGSDANQHAAEFLTLMQRYPLASIALKAAVRVGARRWDLLLQPKTLVKLPEKNLDAALERLARLIQDQRLLERNLATIDLRMLPDRIVIEPNEPETSTTKKGTKP